MLVMPVIKALQKQSHKLKLFLGTRFRLWGTKLPAMGHVCKRNRVSKEAASAADKFTKL